MTGARPETVLSVQGLNKSYGDIEAVKDLSFDVYKGEIFGFLGPNGAGKTTTISMLCGLLKKDGGRLTIDGREVDDHNPETRQRIGLCPQDLVIWESLTCLEQLELVGRLYNIDRKRSRVRALDLLDTLGLTDKKHKQAKTLSGGMKRRLNIALALVHEPEILVLDEPQAGLDPQSRLLVREYIRSLTPEVTVILTTHDMDEADRLSHRVAIIDRGQLLVLDTPDNLKDQVGRGEILEIKIAAGSEGKIASLEARLPGSVSLVAHEENKLRFLGPRITDILQEILATLQKEDIKVEDLTIRKKTLEDVFISLTGRRLRE